MNEEEKKDWINDNYNGNWEMFIDPAAIYDAIHNVGLPDRIAEVLRLIISRHFDAAGNVTDAAGLADEMRSVADALRGK